MRDLLNIARRREQQRERVVDAIVGRVPETARRVLLLGAGIGDAEHSLERRGHDVSVVRFDGAQPAVADVVRELDGRRFDAIVLGDTLHRVDDPVELLREVHTLTELDGSVIATVPRSAPSAPSPAPSPQRVQRWFATAGFTGAASSTAWQSPDGDDADAAAEDKRVLLVEAVKPAPISARPVDQPVRSMVSLGLPVFNGMPYLEESLDALRRQTYQHIEIVISDNGSTDETEDFCRRAAADDPRIRYIRHDENRGAAFNYNHVFEQSRGEFFAWTAHDDLRDVRNVERCVAELERLPSSVVAVASTAVFIDETGELISVDTDDNAAQGERPVARLRHVLRNVNRVNSIWGVTRAAALERTNLIGSFIGSDYVLLAELALVGEVHVIDEQLFSRRLHPEASRAANVSKADVARWFDSEARPPLLSVKQRLAVEYWRAVNRAEMRPVERLVGRAAIPTEMAVREARVRGGSAKQRIKNWFAER